MVVSWTDSRKFVLRQVVTAKESMTRTKLRLLESNDNELEAAR